MVDVSTWSETPASNTTVDGVNIAENCSPASLNNAIRSVMAGVKTFHVSYSGLVTTVSGKVSASGGVFSGTQPTYTGRGAYLHHDASANSSGRVHILAEGAPRPTSPANGDLVFYHS
jgi:hypothetical protein